MKTLKQIREEHDDKFLNSLEYFSEEMMLDEKIADKAGSSRSMKFGPIPSTLKSNVDVVPSAKEMPMMLIFRRVQYKIYPNKQVVALYYSSMVDKYLSVPFGPTGNLNLSEAVVLDSLDEDWQDVNRRDKTDGMSQRAVNTYRREHPGSNLQTAVTEKNPTGKRAARRKAFCSRMGGMKARLTSAKTARDPDSRINKALRRWNCEEEFKAKLYEKRHGIDEATADDAKEFALDVAPVVGTYRSGRRAYDAYKRGDYKQAALHGGLTALSAAGDVALASGVGSLAGAAVKSAAASGARKLAAKGLIGKVTTAPAAETAAKAAAKKVAPAAAETVARDASAMGKSSKAATVTKKVAPAAAETVAKKTAPSVGKRLLGGAGAKLAGAAPVAAGLAALAGTEFAAKKIGGWERGPGKIKTGTSWEKASGHDPVLSSKIGNLTRGDVESTKRALHIKENKISDIRKMLQENINTKDININGRTITLNTSMAKRILEVYDSVNSKNKKIVENMLNEDLESFKRLINFSIRN